MKTTGNSVLIDTSVVIDILSGNKSLADKLSKYEKFYLSSIILGELYVGVYRVINKAKQLEKIEGFINLCSVLPVDEKTSSYYGLIHAELYKKGKPIPTNDVWIAATAKQYNLPLITRDKHFLEIENNVVKLV